MMRYVAIAIIVGAIASCVPRRPAERPDCSDAALARIEADYVADILHACRLESYDACKARPAIDAVYDALRQEWEACE